MDVWNPSLRGLSGRLISYTQSPHSTEYCLSFFYKLYGPNAGKDTGVVKGEVAIEQFYGGASPPGTLNVKLADKADFETLLWTRSGAHGNLWHEAHCPVPAQITDFHVSKYSLKSLNNIPVKLFCSLQYF